MRLTVTETTSNFFKYWERSRNSAEILRLMKTSLEKMEWR